MTMAMAKITPDIFSCSDDEGNLDIEIDMFGVKKENIELKMVEDGFFVRAKREETGVEYAGTYAFCCGVVPEKAVAKYVDGKLYVKVPYRESAETVNVEIQ
jgi:HSP20 family protein